MAIKKEKLERLTHENMYKKLKEGIVFAGVQKADGTVTYRGMTLAPEFLETLFKSRVTNEDKGKARKAHWSDGMTEEEKIAQYTESRKPVFIYDVLRQGYKGASIYLRNIDLDSGMIGDLDNLVFVSKEDVLNNPEFKELQEGKIDVKDFLKGTNDRREEVSWEQKKQLFDRLEEDVYFATFRKRNGEQRKIVMTRNKDLIDEFSGEGAYDTAFKIEDREGDEFLDIITSGVFPVYDLEKGEERKFSIDSSIEVKGYPRLKLLRLDDAVRFSIGEISMDELVFGTHRQRREERKGLTGNDKRAELIADMGSSSTWDSTWQHRMTKLNYMLEKELPKEFKEAGYDLSNVGFSYKSHLNNKVTEIKLGKGEGTVYLMVSPKGVYDVLNNRFEFKTNPGRGKDSNLGGLKDQQERMYLQRNVLGVQKALLINYILKSMDRRKKANTIKYFEDKFLKNTK